MDQGHKAVRKGDGDASGHKPPLARLQHHVLAGAQIGSGVTGVGVGRRFQAGVEHFQLNLHCRRSEPCRAGSAGGCGCRCCSAGVMALFRQSQSLTLSPARCILLPAPGAAEARPGRDEMARQRWKAGCMPESSAAVPAHHQPPQDDTVLFSEKLWPGVWIWLVAAGIAGAGILVFAPISTGGRPHGRRRPVRHRGGPADSVHAGHDRHGRTLQVGRASIDRGLIGHGDAFRGRRPRRNAGRASTASPTCASAAGSIPWSASRSTTPRTPLRIG